VGDPCCELLDAGDGRRLERFGDRICDRPAPTATEPPRDAGAWTAADLRFDKYVGWTSVADDEPGPWEVEDGDLRFELRPTETGQVGLFPEHVRNREWVRSAVARLPAAPSILNLFAYTGAPTLDAAAAGSAVTHVDGSRPTVAWGRRNAELSGLTNRPIRWIVDDADAFVDRELRRERRYDAVILDPPSYGHGGRGKGTAWRLEDRLASLLERCAELTDGDPAFVVLSAHTPGFGPDRLAEELAIAFRRRPGSVDAGDLELRARSGARLRLGAYARMIRE
jgi:23S rRNA (cytosine1962-C5)-methyltransferase